MKWVLSQQSLDHHRWLLQNAPHQAQFTYNLHHQSIRIKSKNNRLFFLEVAGLFQKKIFLRSEYGVVVGEAQWNTAKEPFCLLNGQKIYFLQEDHALQFFDKEYQHLSTFQIEHSLQLDRMEKFALMFSAVWILTADLNNRKAENLLVA